MVMKPKSECQFVSKRSFLSIGFFGMASYALGATQSPVLANSIPTPEEQNILINALNSIDSEVTRTAAKTLELAITSNSPFSLHLRSAGLSFSDAKILANAVKQYASKNKQNLQSFSVSYNPSLGDEGVAVLIHSLPQTVSEIGLVGCGISDIGGQALLKWTSDNTQLNMICVEDNEISESTKMQFRELETKRTGLRIFI